MKEEYISVSEKAREPREAKAPQKKRQSATLAAALILGAAIIALYLSSLGACAGAATDGTNAGEENQAASESDEETRLAAILSSIRGAGKVEVMITYESGPEIVPAMSVDQQESQSVSDGDTDSSVSSRSEPASSQDYGDDGALILKELSPVVRGVVITAEGADDISVRLQLMEAAQTALDIESSQVCVYVMERTDNE